MSVLYPFVKARYKRQRLDKMCQKWGILRSKKPKEQIRYRNDTEIYPLYREQSLGPTQGRNKLINK